MNKHSGLLAVAALLCLVATANGGGGGGGVPQVEGVFGVSPTGPQTYLAMYVPLPEGMALAGLKWYNNDGTVDFPHLLLAGGVTEDPVPVAAAAVMAEDVPGGSSAWSEVTLPGPVVSASEGLYAIFQLPEGSECQGEGAGGGAGIGYCAAPAGLTGWLSIDGENWVRLHSSCGLAAQAVLVEGAAGMQVMRRVETVPVSEPEAAENFVTALLAPGPNPFNPRTELRFMLAERSEVKLAIYDLRGERVRQLSVGNFDRGEHAVAWDGRDGRGRELASGVYIARFMAGRVAMTRRLTLMR